MQASFESIQPNGVLDGTQAIQFRNNVSDLVNKGTKVILVNLKDVTFMDSSGLAAIVIALKTVRSVGGRLCICSINDQVRLLFELTSMTRVFEIFPDQDEFVKTL
ncbi:MAG: STAS domain-containing protein [Cyanobacteria bacterium CRU_2_1]|nr:STAS domain-containing protein [Cyanobacteria bacterium RU_5_0]NJR59550.1 STAS domain-containing protein [Cyanobacteria bacterium CRU_2_1]